MAQTTGRATPDGSPEERTRSTSEDESARLIEVARHILVRKNGSGFTLNEVLEEAGLGTRAFYRHFGSKDELALAVFAEEAEREARRLQARMKHASTPIEGVVAWIDVRLEPGFDPRLAARQRPLTEEAVRASRRFPLQLEPAFHRTLAPLIDQLTRGTAAGDFTGIDPVADAKAIHHVVAGVVEQRWSGLPLRRREARAGVLRFCLCALGVDSSHVTEVLARSTGAGTTLSAQGPPGRLD